MWTLLVLGLAAAWLYHQLNQLPAASERGVVARKAGSPRLVQAIAYAERLWVEKRYLAAEKAYLQVLKLDHKNTQSYTRLGMIYTRQKNFDDAKECFQMAARIEPSGSTFHNLGLAFMEGRNYIKAIASFEKAVVFEATPERYLNLAKAHQKLSNWSQAAAALEKVVELSPTSANLWMLASTHKSARNMARATEIYAQILALDPNDSKAKIALGSAEKIAR